MVSKADTEAIAEEVVGYLDRRAAAIRQERLNELARESENRAKEAKRAKESKYQLEGLELGLAGAGLGALIGFAIFIGLLVYRAIFQ